ncbi:MAG TPA: ABC transporter ATP-binding protein [Actinomycetes bacterium]|nr:ABC transporter ATP-binding protein [Actinomycetes bacterium]
MALLSIYGLSVRLPGRARRPILDGVDLTVEAGEIVGLVGESGSGKSVTARAVLGLTPSGSEVAGRVLVGNVDVGSAAPAQLRTLRSSTVSMVFQDPRAGINPMRTVGDFMTESLRLNRGWSKGAATERAVELLAAVGMPDPPRHLRQHPHELSGGMLQRVMIAAALSTEPALLLCDEPTTALDVTTQAEILAILTRQQAQRGMGMLFITHDLDLASAVCTRVYVMYAGRVVEAAPAHRLFSEPRHPYTVGLLASTPDIHGAQERLVPIPGTPLGLLEDPPGCAFAARCPLAVPDPCLSLRPGLEPVTGSAGHEVACPRAQLSTGDLVRLGSLEEGRP